MNSPLAPAYSGSAQPGFNDHGFFERRGVMFLVLLVLIALVGVVAPGVPGAQAAPAYGITVGPSSQVSSTAKTVTVSGTFPSTIKMGKKTGELSVYLMWCVNPGKNKRATGDQCVQTTPAWVVPKGSAYSNAKLGKMRVTTNGKAKSGKWTFEAKLPVAKKIGKQKCTGAKAKCGVFVRLSMHSGRTNKKFDQFVPVKMVKQAKPAVKAKLSKSRITTSARGKIAATVKVKGVTKPTGTVTVVAGKKKVSVKLVASKRGKVTVKLPKLTKGKHKVKVTFTPSGTTVNAARKASSKTSYLTVR